MIAIISASLGKFDHTEEPKKQSIEHDYFLFTDENFPPRTKAMTPRLQAKIPKFFAWELKPDYEFYLWVDGNLIIKNKKTVEWFRNQCKDSDIVVLRHPKRPDIRQEARYLRKGLREESRYLIGRYDGEWSPQQVEEISKDKDFSDDLLVLGGMFMYRNTPKVQAMLKEWWYLTSRYTVFDQLAFPYVLKKSGIRINIRDELMEQFVQHKKHRYHAR